MATPCGNFGHHDIDGFAGVDYGTTANGYNAIAIMFPKHTGGLIDDTERRVRGNPVI
jgi:hypothetical protein